MHCQPKPWYSIHFSHNFSCDFLFCLEFLTTVFCFALNGTVDACCKWCSTAKFLMMTTLHFAFIGNQYVCNQEHKTLNARNYSLIDFISLLPIVFFNEHDIFMFQNYGKLSSTEVNHRGKREKTNTSCAVNRKQKSKSIIEEHKMLSFIRWLISIAIACWTGVFYGWRLKWRKRRQKSAFSRLAVIWSNFLANPSIDTKCLELIVLIQFQSSKSSIALLSHWSQLVSYGFFAHLV